MTKKKLLSIVSIVGMFTLMFLICFFSRNTNGLYINIQNQIHTPVKKVHIFLYNGSTNIVLFQRNTLNSAESVNEIVNLEKYKGSEYALTANFIIDNKKYETCLCPYLVSVGGKHTIHITIHDRNDAIIADLSYADSILNQKITNQIKIK